MPKKIKTRKQKLHSDLRKQTPALSYTLPATTEKIAVEKPRTTKSLTKPISIYADDYTYLKKDLGKTLLFSVGIAVLELVLRIFVVKS